MQKKKNLNKLSFTQYLQTETRNQGIGTNGSPYITLGGDSIGKNDISHIQGSVYNPGKLTSLGPQTKPKRIELINQEASSLSNELDESAQNQPTSAQRNHQIDHNSSVISNRIQTTMPAAVVDQRDSARIMMELEEALGGGNSQIFSNPVIKTASNEKQHFQIKMPQQERAGSTSIVEASQISSTQVQNQ